MVSTDEFQYLADLAGLDAIGLGMLAPSLNVKHPAETRERLAAKGLIRVLPEPTAYGEPVVELTTKGLRTFRRLALIQARV